MNNEKATAWDNVSFDDLQRCANSRWLSDGSDHNSNKDSSMGPDNVLTALCYFLAALPKLKVS